MDINRYENEGDRVVREVLVALFEAGVERMLVVRWREFLRRLVGSGDATGCGPKIVEGMAIKSG